MGLRCQCGADLISSSASRPRLAARDVIAVNRIAVAHCSWPWLQDSTYQKLWGRFSAETGRVEMLDESIEVRFATTACCRYAHCWYLLLLTPGCTQVVVPSNPSGTDDGDLYSIDILDPDVYLPLSVRLGSAADACWLCCVPFFLSSSHGMPRTGLTPSLEVCVTACDACAGSVLLSHWHHHAPGAGLRAGKDLIRVRV